MIYVLLDDNNIVIQKDIEPRIGFIAAPDSVVCGQIKQGSNYVNPEIPAEMIKSQISNALKAAYSAESDPMFFKWQAGEATKDEWINKRKEIKSHILSIYQKEFPCLIQESSLP